MKITTYQQNAQMLSEAHRVAHQQNMKRLAELNQQAQQQQKPKRLRLSGLKRWTSRYEIFDYFYSTYAIGM